MQVGNASISKLKVYKLQNTLPRLIFESILSPLQVVSDTGNYFANADYFYIFDQYNNSLTMYYYGGPVLSIKYNFVAEMPQAPPILYRVCVTNNNESLFITLQVWHFRDKSVQIDYDNLYEEFQQQIINIDLRKRIKGPLIEFYAADESLT
jgi:hypothetical protein